MKGQAQGRVQDQVRGHPREGLAEEEKEIETARAFSEKKCAVFAEAKPRQLIIRTQNPYKNF